MTDAQSISIHALLAESDNGGPVVQFNVSTFLSTLSLRRATLLVYLALIRYLIFLSTLSLRRATEISLIRPYANLAFLSTLSLRRATIKLKLDFINQEFLSTLSLRRATAVHNTKIDKHNDFYPRSPCGERPYPQQLLRSTASFLSTLSLRRATHPWPAQSSRPIFLSTLSLRRATYYYLRALADCTFLSTLSLRRATIPGVDFLSAFMHFYPRSPCGERPVDSCSCCSSKIISIHALLAESDATLHNILELLTNFYPRSPCGERRCERVHKLFGIDISIHALLAESDRRYGVCENITITFLSTLSLRRATGEPIFISATPRKFLSTLSLRRATESRSNILITSNISIHALLAESDIKPICGKIDTRNFYPRSPCGERHTRSQPSRPKALISIHALLAESDSTSL